MKPLLKALALLAAICCLVWLGVLWWWDRTRHDMSTLDIVWYLMVLPVTVFGLVMLGKWAFGGAVEKAKQREAEQAQAQAEKAKSGAGAGPGNGDGSAQNPQQAGQRQAFQLLGAHASTAVGLAGSAALADLLAAVKAGDSRPEPDSTLTADDGLPLLCTRIPDLDPTEFEAAFMGCMEKTDAVAAEWASEAQRRAVTECPPQADEATLRALAALETALLSSLEDARLHEASLNADPAPPAERPVDRVGAQPGGKPERARKPGAAAAPAAPPPLPPSLRLAWAWPASFNAREKLAAELWLRERVAETTAEWLKPERLQWAAAAAPDGASLWRDAEVFDNLSGPRRRGAMQLLLACHSDLSQEQIDSAERAGAVHTSRRPAAQFAGECAIALSLASPDWPVLEDAPAWCHLSRGNVITREKPIDASGKVTSETTDLLVSQLLEATGLKPSDVSAVVTDADQHTNRSKEYFGTLIGTFGHLDAADDSTVLGAALGRLGPAGPLLTAAAAAQMAKSSESTCLGLSLGDPLQRFAVVASPPPPPTPSA
jgi:hypothetical protein